MTVCQRIVVMLGGREVRTSRLVDDKCLRVLDHIRASSKSCKKCAD